MRDGPNASRLRSAEVRRTRIEFRNRLNGTRQLGAGIRRACGVLQPRLPLSFTCDCSLARLANSKLRADVAARTFATMPYVSLTSVREMRTKVLSRPSGEPSRSQSPRFGGGFVFMA